MMTLWPPPVSLMDNNNNNNNNDMVQQQQQQSSSHWILTVQPDWTIHSESTQKQALKQIKEWIHPCKDHALKQWKSTTTTTTTTATTTTTTAKDIVSEMARCIQTAISPTMQQLQQRLEEESIWRKQLAQQFETYTCADDTLPTTRAIAIQEWIDPTTTNNNNDDDDDTSPPQQQQQQPYTVHILHHRPASQIHLIEHFITDEECDAIHQEAGPHLTAASTFDETGGITYSESRKAMQSSISITNLPQNNPIYALYKRIIRYANDTMGRDGGGIIEIRAEGQENLMSIQYVGRGMEDTTPDQYLPHCDGNCNGKPHVFATRVASMVLYCDVPIRGGATNFQNVGIHIHPTKNAGLFFSYMNPKTMMMDHGYTTHSGCPVYDGIKRIVTEWMRVGVTEDVPWNAYNTLGKRLSPEMDTLRKKFQKMNWTAALAAMGKAQNNEEEGGSNR
jgi:hypothetical protein